MLVLFRIAHHRIRVRSPACRKTIEHDLSQIRVQLLHLSSGGQGLDRHLEPVDLTTHFVSQDLDIVELPINIGAILLYGREAIRPCNFQKAG